jgi:flagellar basal body-associated protein FliL
VAEGVDESEAAEGEKKKGGAKKLIIKIVPLVLIALVIAKMTVLKPPPPTAAQAAAKATATKLALDTKCALANDMKPPRQSAEAAGTAKTDTATTATTAASTTPTTKPELKGPVLELDSKTMNLDGTHFLKIGISLQLPAKAVPDTVKTTENWSSIASQLVLDTFSGRSFAELSNDGLRQRLQHQIGNDVCEKTAGEVETLYFIDFVMQ